jgi:RNA polymerase sigma-70 factor, ECF subfamily
MDHETTAQAPIDLAALYTTYGPVVYRFFHQHIGNAQDAEDLTAAAFTKALTSLNRYQEQGRLTAWLFSIARHTLLDEQRRRMSRLAHISIEPTLADTRPLPETQVLQSEQARLLYDLIEQLPDDQREALILRFFGEIDSGQIAERMGRSAGAIKMLIHRAIARLRERYRQSEQAAALLFERCTVLLAAAPAPRYAYALQPAYRYQLRRAYRSRNA